MLCRFPVHTTCAAGVGPLPQQLPVSIHFHFHFNVYCVRLDDVVILLRRLGKEKQVSKARS